LASVELRGLTKRFGSLAVVDDVSLRIDHGQLVCLLGPSGCGKTTTLRLIAGFLEPSDGEIHVGERLVSSKVRTLPPEQRKMSMIFQSYALWPHMTVTENIVLGNATVESPDEFCDPVFANQVVNIDFLQSFVTAKPQLSQTTWKFFRFL